MIPRRSESVPYLLFILTLSVLAVVALAISAFGRASEDTRAILGYADKAACLLFFVDFLVLLVRSENRWRYFAAWGWLDLISSIPGTDLFRLGRTTRVLRILRVLRGLKAARALTVFILHRRAQSTFLAALLVAILLIVFSSSAILQFETSPEANIRTPEDAIWWAVVTVTTVGYGDKFPLSAEGRLVAILLMTAGVGLFGMFSGFVAAWFLEAPQHPSAESQVLARLEEEVRKLREQLEKSGATP
jgi:voltage-gated potassium channel